MKQDTRFLKLAERIANHISADGWYVCYGIKSAKHAHFIKSWFKPTDDESRKYKHLFISWLGTQDGTVKEDNEGRVLFCLMAHELLNEVGMVTPDGEEIV